MTEKHNKSQTHTKQTLKIQKKTPKIKKIKKQKRKKKNNENIPAPRAVTSSSSCIDSYNTNLNCDREYTFFHITAHVPHRFR